MCARMASRPRFATVWYRGIPYQLDLVRCRRALVDRQVEGGLNSMGSLAREVGKNRSTASRFFSGRPTSLTVTLKVLGALHLTFEEVARPLDDQDNTDGPSSTAPPANPSPPRPQPGLGLLGLSTHTRNCLTAAGITTVDQVLARTKDDLLGIRYLGSSSLAEIRRKLIDKGLVPADQIATILR
jgi:hypothetical protein